MARKSAIEKDAAMGHPLYFRKKANADLAKAQARKHGIKIRLTKVKDYGYKLAFVK